MRNLVCYYIEVFILFS